MRSVAPVLVLVLLAWLGGFAVGYLRTTLVDRHTPPASPRAPPDGTCPPVLQFRCEDTVGGPAGPEALPTERLPAEERPPEALEKPWVAEPTRRCANRGGHRLVVSCEEWPCIAAIVYRDEVAYDAAVCRETLPPELPSKVFRVEAGGLHIHTRMYWLADASLIERWQDQAWTERQTARERMILAELPRLVAGPAP